MRIISQGRYYLLILLVVFFTLEARKVLALTASIGPDGCNAQAVHAFGYTGQNVLVGVFSQSHARVSHEAFFDNYPTGTSYATWFDATGDSTYEPYWHDTAMAGIVGSRGGSLYPAEIGVAPDCEILSVRITKPVSDTDPARQISIPWIEAGLDELLSQGGRVAVTGIQFPPTDPFIPDGDSQYSLMYDYYAYTDDILFINAAGNDYSSVTVFGDGFNGITTGGLVMPETGVYRQVGTASNPGPTADGRRKPEITAPAQTLWLPYSSSDTIWTTQGTTRGETSWAGPHAAGVAALLLQYANSSAEGNDGKSAVIKAVMVNSTFPNIKTKTGQVTTGQTWNAQRGYGRVDALRAYHELASPKLAAGGSTTQSAGWNYQTIGSNGLHTYSIYGHKNQRLLLTVTWHRAVSKNITGIYSESSPKLNLNLYIFDPQNNQVFADINTPDNLRKADIVLAADGYYQVQAANTTNINNRNYAMAFELLEPLEADFNVDSIVDTSDLLTLAGSWLAVNCANAQQACYWYDLAADGRIDFQDMAILSADWLTIDPRYYPVP